MGKVNKSVQKRIEVNKKNKERWRDKIKVQENITSKEEPVKKEEVIISNDGMLDRKKHVYDYVEEKKESKIKIEIKGYGKRKGNQSRSTSLIRKKYSLLTERVFETRRAQDADEKRKEQLWKTVEKMRNDQGGFDR